MLEFLLGRSKTGFEMSSLLRVRYQDFSTYTHSKTVSVWTSDIFVVKRVSMQLLAEFIGKQKIRLVGVGVSRLRERDTRQMLITDF